MARGDWVKCFAGVPSFSCYAGFGGTSMRSMTLSISLYSRGFLGRHEAIAVGVLLDLVERVAGVLEQDLVQLLA